MGKKSLFFKQKKEEERNRLHGPRHTYNIIADRGFKNEQYEWNNMFHESFMEIGLIDRKKVFMMQITPIYQWYFIVW